MNPMISPYGYSPYYSPMMTPQQRLAEMEQQYPQFSNQGSNQMSSVPQNNMVNMSMSQNFVKCRAVTSIDEAKASMIDLDGSIHVFTDIGNKRIYTKQINLDGTATLNTYVLQEKPIEPVQLQESSMPGFDSRMFVKQEELEAVCKNFAEQLDELQDQIKGYERAFAMLQEDKQKSVSKTGGKK